MRKIAPAAVILLLSLSLLEACGEIKNEQQAIFVRESAPRVGYLAPEFQLNSLEGQTLGPGNFKGKAVLLNFWATWCEPCKTEMPELSAALKRYSPEKLVILGINPGEDPARVRQYLQTGGYNWPVLFDFNGSLKDRYGVNAYPSTYFIDREGFIRFIKLGALDKQNLSQRLAEII